VGVPYDPPVPVRHRRKPQPGSDAVAAKKSVPPLGQALVKAIGNTPHNEGEAARAAGIHPSTLSKWINGRLDPGYSLLSQAMRSWNWSLAQLESDVASSAGQSPTPYDALLYEKAKALTERTAALRERDAAVRKAQQLEKMLELAEKRRGSVRPDPPLNPRR